MSVRWSPAVTAFINLRSSVTHLAWRCGGGTGGDAATLWGNGPYLGAGLGHADHLGIGRRGGGGGKAIWGHGYAKELAG